MIMNAPGASIIKCLMKKSDERSMGSLKSKKVIVTGAGGFIGSHLCEALVDEGAKVTALVKYNARGCIGNLALAHKDKRAEMNIVAGNIEDPHFVREICKGQEIVFHLAALIGIPYSYIAPSSYVRTNVEGTVNILEAARLHGAERVIHTSTSETYGTADYEPIDEMHPLKGQSPYSASKIAADKMAESYYRSFNLPVVTVRPFNTYGPRQSARAVIPTIIAQALERDVVSLGSTEPQRDMTYVSDTVRGFIAAATVKNTEGNTINLGYGSTSSIGDIAEMIFSILGRDIRIETDKKRIRPDNSEVYKLISNNGKAQELLGWKPEVSLEKGLRETISFIEKNRELFNTEIYAV